MLVIQIFILFLFHVMENQNHQVSCEVSHCLKLPYHYDQLTLYKNEVNSPSSSSSPSNLKTSTRIDDDGEKEILFELEFPQEGHCFFWDEQVCVKNQESPEKEWCQEYNNQSMWFVLPFHNFLRTYKVTSLVNDADGGHADDHTKYTWTGADHCAFLFQKEQDDHSFCNDFEYALILQENESFLADSYDFKSVLIQPGCQLLEYVIGKWESMVDMDVNGMVEFREEVTQYYCHCQYSRKFELGITTVFPPDYKAERITSVPWIWNGMDMNTDEGDGGVVGVLESVRGNTSWESNAVLFLCENENSILIIKGVLVIVMIIAVVDTTLLWIYIWMGVERGYEEEEDEDGR